MLKVELRERGNNDHTRRENGVACSIMNERDRQPGSWSAAATGDHINMATTRLYIATPCAHNVVVSQYAAPIFYVAQMLERSGTEVDIQFLSISDLELSRSVLASRFLAQPSFTHLLFIDADTSFEPMLVRRMLEFDEDFVSTMYAKRALDLERLIAHARHHPEEDARAVVSRCLDYVGLLTGETSTTGREKMRVKSRGGFVTAAHTGMGLCLLKRRVLEEMVARGIVVTDGKPSAVSPWPVPYYSFFHKERISESALFSEDISFCRRWTRGCGGTIWVCVDQAVGHHGMFRFNGAFVEKLKAGEV